MTQSKTEARQQLVSGVIASEPFELDGFQWCAMPQTDMAAKLDFSISTLNRLIRKPPFVRDRTHREGKPITLVREGQPGAKTPRHVANIMSRIWRQRFNRYPTRAEYGCMIGLAETWPDGRQVEIFKLIVSPQGWAEFMAGVHIDVELLGDLGKKRFYKFPTLSVMRLFHSRAVERYQMQQQSMKAGSTVPKPITVKPGPHPALEALKAKA